FGVPRAPRRLELLELPEIFTVVRVRLPLRRQFVFPQHFFRDQTTRVVREIRRIERRRDLRRVERIDLAMRTAVGTPRQNSQPQHERCNPPRPRTTVSWMP